MTNLPDPNDWLQEDRKPTAVYFADADCVEYVAEDTICVYDRVDPFLTLIFDETKIIPVGFKLKGFRNCFEQLKAEVGWKDSDFIELVPVVERACSRFGERKYGDSTRRKLAYQAAAKLAKDVKLYDFPQAA